MLFCEKKYDILRICCKSARNKNMLLSIIFADFNFFSIKSGVGELVNPVAQDSHGAAAVEGDLTRQVNVPKHVVPHLGMQGRVLVAERLQALAAHLFETLLFLAGACDAVLLRPASGNGIGPARMHAGI